MFSFPSKNNILLDKWVNALKRKNFKPTQWSRVCSEHFTEEDYVHRPDSNRPLLKIDSVPSIFKAFPSYLQPKPIKIRKLPAQRNQLRIGKYQCISRYIKLNSEFDLGAYGHRLNTVFDLGENYIKNVVF